MSPTPESGKAPTQQTPKGKEIPVPKKGEVLDALRKAAQPQPEKAVRDEQGKE